ncbi:MAG: hypothetical protein LBH75_05105, partial [Treponema sp.]|nr:hypothetical protein [Treponema sp.]
LCGVSSSHYAVCHPHTMRCVILTLCGVSSSHYAVCHPHTMRCVILTLCGARASGATGIAC